MDSARRTEVDRANVWRTPARAAVEPEMLRPSSPGVEQVRERGPRDDAAA